MSAFSLESQATPKQITKLLDGDASVASSATGKARAHIDRVIRRDVRALVDDSGDDTVSQVCVTAIFV